MSTLLGHILHGIVELEFSKWGLLIHVADCY